MTVLLGGGLDAALALAADRLEHGDAAERARAESLARNAGPLDLALELNPRLRRTPATELVSRELEWAITTPGARLVLSMPPQETKTSTLRMAALRKLQHDPEKRNAIASYAVDLARTSGRFVRTMIETHGSGVTDPATGQPLPDHLGLRVRQDHAAAGDWSLEGHDGALYAIGVGGGLTGRPVDGVLFIDDPVKDREQADSPVYREKVAEWRSAVAETRLGPEASVVLIMTRWHEQDLAGRVIAEDMELPPGERELRIINIPALAHPDVPDALEGIPGARDEHGWLVSVRGRSTAQWERIRRRVGERTFGALYQGSPRPLEGGVFAQVWIDQHRVRQAPPLARIEVGVDPADTGTGDDAGVLVAGASVDGHMFVLEDLSGPLSRAAWARVVCLAVVRHNASCVVSERTLGMQTAVAEAWSLLVRQATALRGAGGDVDEAARRLAAAGDVVAAGARELDEIVGLVDDILARPSSGPCRLVVVTPRQSKQVRAESITVYYETGRAHHVGVLGRLEHEQVTWVAGQKSPNRLDTLAHLLTHLDGSSQPVAVSSPAGSPRAPQRVGARPARVAIPRR